MIGILLLVAVVWYVEAANADSLTRMTVMYPNYTDRANDAEADAKGAPPVVRFGYTFPGKP